MSPRVRTVLVLAGAAAVLVSGWVHFHLYFRGGYRGIAPEEVLGITVSRSFALQAVAAVVIAEALVLSLRVKRLLLPATVAGVVFAGASLVAYWLSRTSGLLGFEEHTTTTDATVAIASEVIAIAVLLPVAVQVVVQAVASAGRRSRQAAPDAATDSAAPASSASA